MRNKRPRYVTRKGYVRILNSLHPRANQQGYVLEHILVLEQVLGRAVLPIEAPHHIDEDRANNEVGNLILFIRSGDHTAFHKRLNAFKVSGHWHWRKCKICKQYDDPLNLYINKKHRHVFHRECATKYRHNHHHLIKAHLERRLVWK